MTIEEINKICRGTFIDLLNIEFTAYSDSHVEAVMKISPELYQPAGFVHGGALISLAVERQNCNTAIADLPDEFVLISV